MQMKTNSQQTNNIWIGVTMSFALLLLFAAPQRAVAQWTTSGNNISNTNTGNVGIGTTSPGAKVHISGAASGVSPSSTFAQVAVENSGSAGVQIMNPDNQIGRIMFGTPSAVGSGGSQPRISALIRWDYTNNIFDFATDQTNGYLRFLTGVFAERMRIDANGNVGIGTTSPGAKLDVSGSTFLQYVTLSDATSYGAISFRETGGSSKGHIGMTGSGSGSTYIGGANAFQIWNGQNTPMVFGTNGTERARIDASGNVGIGTTTPGYKLDVAGRIRSSADGFMFPDGTVQLTASPGGTITGVTAGAGLTGGGTSGSVTLTNDDRGSSQFIFKNVANAAGTTQFSATSNSDTLLFEGTGGTTISFGAKKVTIDSSAITSSQWTTSGVNNINYAPSGNVGIGTPNPTSKLHVTGDVTVTGTVEGGNIKAKYQDVAEWVPASEQLSAGTVVVLDSTKSNQVIASTVSYDIRVAGVVSANPGIALGEKSDSK